MDEFFGESIEQPKIKDDLIKRLKKNAYQLSLLHSVKHDDELLYGMKREISMSYFKNDNYSIIHSHILIKKNLLN